MYFENEITNTTKITCLRWYCFPNNRNIENNKLVNKNNESIAPKKEGTQKDLRAILDISGDNFREMNLFLRIHKLLSHFKNASWPYFVPTTTSFIVVK